MRYTAIAIIGVLLLYAAGCPAGRQANNSGNAAAKASGQAAAAQAKGQAAGVVGHPPAPPAQPQETNAQLAEEAQGFHFGDVYLDQELPAVEHSISQHRKKLSTDTVTAAGDGEMATAEQEKFEFRNGILVAYASPAIFGMSEAEYDDLTADFNEEYSDAEHGSGSLPAGFSVPAGDNANAARLEYWLRQEPRELLVAGWRAKDGYYWVYMSLPEEAAAAAAAEESAPGEAGEQTGT